jgi:multidrug resistance efflux pump
MATAIGWRGASSTTCTRVSRRNSVQVCANSISPIYRKAARQQQRERRQQQQQQQQPTGKLACSCARHVVAHVVTELAAPVAGPVAQRRIEPSQLVTASELQHFGELFLWPSLRHYAEQVHL